MPRTFEAEVWHEAVCTMIQRIPPGKVASYGMIATLVGRPDCPRQVGIVLKHLPSEQDAGGLRFHDGTVPWQRVINAKGQISPRGYPGGADRQADALRREGVRLRRTFEGWELEGDDWWEPKPEDSSDEAGSEDHSGRQVKNPP